MLKANWILMMLLVLCLAAVANAQNLFTNGDAEIGGDATTPPDGWEPYFVNASEGTVGVSSDTPDGSSQSTELTGGETAGYDYWTQCFIASAEGDYGDKEFTFSFDYKGDVYTTLFDHNWGGITGAIWERVTEWTHYEVTFTAPAGTEQFNFGMYDNSGGPGNTLNSALYDNIVITEVGGAELLMGDANRDGQVSAGDYASVQANFGNVGVENDPELYGDANLDGQVSAGDYASVQANFGNVLPTAVPEPMTMTMIGLGGLAMLRRRK